MKTIHIRIAVAVGSDGRWNASGWRNAGDEDKVVALDGLESDNYQMCYVEADVPVPETTTVQGSVTA